MAKTLWTTSAIVTFNQNTTSYIPCGCCELVAQTSGNEARAKITQRAAGTLSNLLVNVYFNNAASDATLRTRLNGANGGLTATIINGSTGQFTDLSGSDVVASGDTLNYQLIIVVDDPFVTIDVAIISATFAASTNTVMRYAATSTLSADLSDGSTYYSGLGGGITIHTTEAWHQFDTNAAATYKNLYVYVATNLGTSATPIFVRQNGANTTVTVSCTALTTGIFEDQFSVTGDSVTTAANDDMNYSIVTNNLSVFQLSVISVEATSTDATFHSIDDPTISIGGLGPGLTTYVAMGGGSTRGAPEGHHQNKMAMAATTSNLTIYVTTDTIT